MPVTYVLCPREASWSRSRRVGWRIQETCRTYTWWEKLIELLVKNLFSLAIAAVAMEIFIRDEAVRVPS
ncbi:hypothetical protein DPMN_143060 [Dreissena polymorpha]|uniref:Uncharacterized protein n=1 Tax=Dreissena polymorpha TaxID=45954 RepID=A0A9D4GFI1_DREPO|nr:hypothetical protein DPMN_143060 [Dreissena polymorpha]